MDPEIKNAVNVTDQDAQYDDRAKRLLGNKIILAHILVKTVDEFKGMNPKDVVSCTEGEPFIGVVPVEPGLTNAEKEKDGQRIVGLNTENAEINEGLVRFAIIFYVRMKDGHHRRNGILSMELTVSEKLEIIQNEYSIPIDDTLRKDVSAMCNLSQGIREKVGAEREKNHFKYAQEGLYIRADSRVRGKNG